MCTGCGCTTPNVKCSLTFESYNANGCLNKTDSVTTNLGVCADVQANAYYKATVAVVGTCTAGTGSASGVASAVQGRTVCCK